MKLDRWVKRLTDIESPYEDDLSELAQRFDLSSQRWFSALGTIGLGNHFAELQRVEKIHNSELFTSCGLDKEKLFLLVHSGSRGLGASIMDSHIRENGSVGLTVDSEAGETYLERHDYAVKWGKANRELISQRFLGALNMNGTPVLDLTHNSVTPESFGNETLWVHRKGANPSNQGVAIIAGSRGTLSYLVKPIGDLASTNFSLAHGAGRKWKRSEMAGRLKAKHQLSELTQTPLGGRVICEDRALLFEEAPEAYKNIHQVITDLETHGLIEVIASFRPLLTYKTRERR